MGKMSDYLPNAPAFADPDLTLEQFHLALLKWWHKHHRSFPWRETDNPFHLLMSELMLRRTRADQVVAVYNHFTSKYPDANTLASADPEQVAEDLYSLGLAWRIPAFQEIAKLLYHEFDGKVPERYSALLTLPGVGDYVASAVCCFAFDQPVKIVDTNTVRIIGRVYDIDTHRESRRDKKVRNLVEITLNLENPRDHNYALLDLAAKICLPREPLCKECPLSSFCAYYQRSRTPKLHITEHCT